MVIKELKFKNFGIYLDEQCLDFRCNDRENIILIGGMNGRGKTTILEAILLALYGRRSISFIESGTSYTEFLRNYINKEGNEETSIELFFGICHDETQVDIRVRRSWSEGKRISDTLEVWRNSHRDKYLAKNWDTYVERILPSGIASLFFFDGEKISRLASEETDDEMKKSIKALLGLDIIDRVIVDVRRISTRKQNEVSIINEDEEIKDLHEQLTGVNLSLSKNKSDLARLNTRKIKYQNELAKKEGQFIKTGGSLALSRSDLLKEKGELLEAIDNIKQGLVEIAAGSMPLLAVKPLLENIYNANKEEEMIKSARYGKNLLEKLDTRLIEKLQTVDIMDSEKRELASFFKDEIGKINDLASKEQLFNLSPLGSQLLESLLVDDFNSALRKANKKINEYYGLENRLEQVEGHLLVEIDAEETDKLLKDIKHLTKEITEIESKQKLLQKEIERSQNEQKNLKRNINKLIQKMMDSRSLREDAARIVKYTHMTAKVMERFRQKILKNRVRGLADKIMQCFKHLNHKTDLLSHIEIDSDTLNLRLYDSGGNIVLKSRLSAGEKQMLAVSMLWGLASYSGLDLPVIIDTPLGRLDSSHRSNFITQYLPNAGHQIVVLSTDEEINGSYLTLLDDHICKKYLLQYHEEREATEVVEGYFSGEAS